ncbi:MAG: leucine-rich repeat domain-containing protein, partial [Clostridia bacterium]|nr:leucine-rich repeat domain-containing protein [Clostridia bacterium]
IKTQLISGKNEYRVIGLGLASELDIVIPATYSGLPVTEIGDNAFQGCSYIESVEIPDTVTCIGSYAFSAASGGNYSMQLKTVSFGVNSQLKTIKDHAFMGCNNLTEISIPKTVTSIGLSTFNSYSYEKVRKVHYAGTIDEWVQIEFCEDRYNAGASPLYDGKAELYIGDELVSGIISISSPTIKQGAFRGYTQISGVIISKNVIQIATLAFYNCNNLTDVYYEGTASEWNEIDIALYDNTSLTNATLYYYIENEADVPTDGGNYWHYVDGVPTAW